MFNLNSLWFVPALAVVVTLYYIVPKKYQNVLLLLVSLSFYFSFSVASGCWLIMSIAVLYLISGKLRDERYGRYAFATATLLTLGSLVILKYLDFVLSPFGIAPMKGIIAPLGISFYSFQSFSYIMDVKRGKTEPEKNPIIFALYVSFFPSILSGPICRADIMLPQYRQGRTFLRGNIDDGAAIYIMGLLKKAVIADIIGSFVDGVFFDVKLYSGFTLISALFGFAFQLYFDFSGYSDMAVGAAKMLGIDLPVNFRAPYFATSYRDFWNRWHISLTKWFTDYLYIPLGGNRRGTFRKYMNILIVFAVSGLWHGAGLTFIVWGLLQGVFRIADEFIYRKKIVGEDIKIHIHAFRSVIVTAAWSFSMVFFRSPNIKFALMYITKCFSFNAGDDLFSQIYNIMASKTGGTGTYMVLFFVVLLLSLVVAIVYDVFVYRSKEETFAPSDMRRSIRVVMILIAVVAVLLIGNFGTSNFIYFNF